MTSFAEFLTSPAGRMRVKGHGGRAAQDYITREVLAAAPLKSWPELLAYLQRHDDLESSALETARALSTRYTRAAGATRCACQRARLLRPLPQNLRPHRQ